MTINKINHREDGISLGRFINNIQNQTLGKRTNYVGLPEAVFRNRSFAKNNSQDQDYINESDEESTDSDQSEEGTDYDEESDYCSDE